MPSISDFRDLGFVYFLLMRYQDALLSYALVFLILICACASTTLGLRYFSQRIQNNVASQEVRNTLSRNALWATGFLIALFIFQVWWFRSYSIWDEKRLFATDGFGVIYSLMRAVHFVMLGAVTLSAGFFLLKRFSTGNFFARLGNYKAGVLAAFVGIAAIRLIIFPLGFVSLLRFEVLVVLAILFLCVGGRHLYEWTSKSTVEISRTLANITWGQFSVLLFLTSVIVFLFFGVALLNVLYVTNENGDYLTHYGPYYDAVITTKGLWPNDVWYQFFYSKGEGYGFLSMVLSDRLGKQLSALFCFFVACAAFFELARREFKSALWAALALIVVISFFVNDDSGAFEKHHAAVAAALIAIAYCTYHVFSAASKDVATWVWIGSTCMASLVMLSMPAVAYAAIMLIMLLVGGMFWKQWLAVKLIGIWLVVGGVSSAILLLLNYLVTGLPEITPFTLWLRLLNEERFSDWVSLVLLQYLLQGSAGFQFEGLSAGIWGAITATRVDKVAGLVFHKWTLIFPTIAFVALLYIIRRGKLLGVGLNFAICCLVCGGVMIGYLIVKQPVSVYRASVFSVFFITPIVFSLALVLIRTVITERMTAIVMSVAVFIIVAKSVVFANFVDPQKIEARLSFLSGKASLADAYAYEYGVPTKLYSLKYKFDDGGRWLYTRASNKLGLAHFVKNGIESEISYSLGNKWHVIAFGSAAQAKEELRRQGFKYFLLDLYEPAFGALPFSALFSPSALAENFRLVDQVGSLALLTWKDVPETDVSHEMRGVLVAWSETLANSQFLDIYLRTRYIYETQGLNWASPRELNSVGGWQ